MSQENVEAFKRAVEAMNRRDYEAVLEESDPEVEWHPGVLSSLEGRPTVYRGHEGMLEWIRELEAAFGEKTAPASRTEFDLRRNAYARLSSIPLQATNNSFTASTLT